MLIKCSECELPISDKAVSCPHCGLPLLKSFPKNHPRVKSRMRLPNGFGQITELKGRRLRKPFRAMVTVGKNINGRPICKILSYHETYNDAYAALVEYNKNPYDLDSEITVSDLYDKWSKEYFKNITNSSRRTIKSSWKYCDSVYTMRVKDIRVRHIKGCMDSCNSQNIKARIKSMFNIMLDYAVEYEICDKNYARDFKSERPEVQDSHIAFTEEEMNKLWANSGNIIVDYILIQCYTGFRPQELCMILNENVDLKQNIIIGGMKTESGTNRIVPIHNKIIELVKKYKAMSISLDCRFLTVCPDGSQMTYSKYNKNFHRIMRELGLNEQHKPHDPRKQFVTMAKAVEVNEYAVKRIIGHAIDDLTESVYTERNVEWLRKELDKI